MKKTSTKLVVRKAAAVPQDGAVAEQFRQQLQRVAEAEQNSLRQRVILGAMLIKWERFLGDGRGRGNDGEGLKGWLATNLPELGYSAAHGYKQLAVKALEMLGGGAMALESLVGGESVMDPAGETVDIDAEIIERREEIFATADSRRKLEQMYFDFAGEKKKGKAGRPKGSKAKYDGYQAEALQPAAAARALWSKVMEPALDVGLPAAAKLLAAKDVADALAVLEPLVAILKERKSELK